MRRLTILLLFIVQQSFGQNAFTVKEAKLSVRMPNTEWSLASKEEGALTSYIFKRKPITDSKGSTIIPAIMIYVEDASSFEQDVTLFSATKRMLFVDRGLNVEKILIHENEDYPIAHKNSILTICSYADNNAEEHILYMIHLITKDNKGVQIYMDMTKDLEKEYSSEFWKAMRSIKEVK